ncbi:MAG: hypothetical protein LBS71_00440 [Puniceicoccales bacterium]|jgi:UDP-N-acetylmuramoyl-tripeptide--D-alanyl-D-alanine ligase|nr:hypothetical protein [Puniceicoccales bacterium]
MKTSFFQQLPQATFFGAFPEEVNGFWNDTRTLRPGDCFLALTAQRDGHTFLPHARQQGAACAIVQHIHENLILPQVQVPDVFEAAKTLAKLHRKHYIITAITGSYGKTSTKDMLKRLLGDEAYATPENLNNELGVTLSLSRMGGERFGVIEGGIDHPGEMDLISDLIRPDIAITTGITFTHVANFENFEQLVSEKCKILRDTLERGRIGIVGEQCLTYSIFKKSAKQCIVIGQNKNISRFPSFTYFKRVEKNEVILEGNYFSKKLFQLPKMSAGQVDNFAKVATVAKILGVSDEVIQNNIMSWQPGHMRGEEIIFRGHKVFLDTYNANPVAMLDALRYFDEQYSGENTYVLGGMRELGKYSDSIHRQFAEYFIGKQNITVFAIGIELEVFCKYLEYAKFKGKLFYFQEINQAKNTFNAELLGSVFVKGSQFYHLWELINKGCSPL